MDSNVSTTTQTSHFNFNTGYSTSNRENAKIFNPDALRDTFKQVRPVEDMTKIGAKLPEETVVDRTNNSINLAAGTTINLNGGYKLILSAQHGFELSGEVGDEKYFKEAREIRGALNRLLQNTASDTTRHLEDRLEDYDQWEKYISQVLSKYGIDTSKDFTFNGMKFVRNDEGKLESQRESDAKLAYKIQTANNQTYEFADERTKKLIAYRTDYYLQTAPEEVKNLWNDTMKEMGINPFSERAGSTIGQLAMEQDFATGGNDQLFGNSVESSIEAVNKILERIENPLGTVTEEKSIDLQEEKEFYTTFLSKLKGSIGIS
jgi:hypothetical protein